MKTASYYIAGFITLLALSSLSYANPHAEEMDRILAQKEEPTGVVFEIVTSESDSLDWALPMVNDYIGQLKSKFPEIEVVIVTHGNEQFALATSKAEKKTKVHSLTQQLNKQGVQLHICGTLAGWRGLTDEDFPDYVNVAAAGPAQINDYVSVGFTLLVIREPD